MDWKEPKIVIDIARGLLAVLLAISAFSMALAQVSQLAEFSEYLYLLSVFCIVLTARLCDGMLDVVTPESWAKVLGRKDMDQFKKEFFKFDGLLFRTKMFGNTYLIFSVMVAIIAIVGSVGFINIFQTESNASILGFVKLVSGTILFWYISYQMLTIKSAYGSKVFAAVMCVLIGLLVYVQFY